MPQIILIRQSFIVSGAVKEPSHSNQFALSSHCLAGTFLIRVIFETGVRIVNFSTYSQV